MSRIDDIEMRVGYSVAYRLVPAVTESDLNWLLAEHRRMEAEIARYRDALEDDNGDRVVAGPAHGAFGSSLPGRAGQDPPGA